MHLAGRVPFRLLRVSIGLGEIAPYLAYDEEGAGEKAGRQRRGGAGEVHQECVWSSRIDMGTLHDLPYHKFILTTEPIELPPLLSQAFRKMRALATWTTVRDEAN